VLLHLSKIFLSSDTCDRHADVGADSDSDTAIANKYIHYYDEILHHPITNATMHNIVSEPIY